jgi:hypothetical protein
MQSMEGQNMVEYGGVDPSKRRVDVGTGPSGFL